MHFTGTETEMSCKSPWRMYFSTFYMRICTYFGVRPNALGVEGHLLLDWFSLPILV